MFTKFRVLVACESSGRVRDAFRELGADAWSCDIEASDKFGHHLHRDIKDVLDWDWDCMIAHPPCTYLAVSGMHWTTRGLRDPQLTEDALEFVQMLMDAPIYYKAIENPVSVISSRIRKPNQIIQPYEFGDNASKKTCLWLENLPPLYATDYVLPRYVNGKPRWANQLDSGHNHLGPSKDRAKIRAMTYPGIAKAMAEQWMQHMQEIQSQCDVKQLSLF